MVSPQPPITESLAATLERVFARCFQETYNTQLCGGFDEPLYLPPASTGESGSIQYREDYSASALHEVAHWCIAGPQRRTEVDYGYWYTPDGRNVQQQRAFERVEALPQAMEWFFAQAAGIQFRISADNLNQGDEHTASQQVFKQRVLLQAQRWQEEGLPERAQIFFDALCTEFNRDSSLASVEFHITALG